MKQHFENPECQSCPAHTKCASVCLTPPLKTQKPLFVVMDMPDFEDDKHHTFFEARRALFLKNLMDKVCRVELGDVHFTYVQRFRPSDYESASKEDADTCFQLYLLNEIVNAKPRAIITVGETASQVVTGSTQAMSRMRGQDFDVEFSDADDDKHVCRVFPIYGVGYVERNEGAMIQMAKDIQRAYHYSIDFVQPEGKTKWRLVKTTEDLHLLMDYCEQMGVACFDYETSGLDIHAEDFYAIMLGISFQPGGGWAIALQHWEQPILEETRQEWLSILEERFFGNPKIQKIAHNLKFDIQVSKRIGISKFKGRWDDTMLMHHLLDENKLHGLKDIAPEFYPEFEGYEQEVKKYKWVEVPLKLLAPYCVTDTDLTLRLHTAFEDWLLEDEFLYTIYRNLTMPVSRALQEMEWEGAFIDVDFNLQAIADAKLLVQEQELVLKKHPKVKKFEAAEREIVSLKAIEALELKITMAKLERSIRGYREKIEQIKTGQIDDYAGLNFASPPQMARLFYEPHGFKFKKPYDRKKKGEGTGTGKEIISDFNDKTGFVEALLLYRSLQKTLSTYLEGIYKRLDPYNRLHTSFLVHGTTTGRLSSRDPNLQNLPTGAKAKDPKEKEVVKWVKKLFVAPEGYVIMQADFSQAELRIVADYAQEDNMIAAYKAGKDIHAVTGAKLSGHTFEDFIQLPKEDLKRFRTMAKPANFGLIYGQSAAGYQVYAKNNYGVVLTDREASKHRDQFFELYPKLLDYHDLYIEKAKRFGFVRTIYGRKRRLLEINSFDKIKRGEAERQAINSPIQGTAGEFTEFSIALLRDRLNTRVKMFNTVHDSIVFYIPPDILEETAKMISLTCENLPNTEYFARSMKSLGMKVDLEYSPLSWGELEPYEA